MARIRTIKPEFWRDDGLSAISAEASLLAIGLLNVADDEGYFNANPKLIEADVFPLRELSVSVHALINELSNIGYIHLFSCDDGKKYGLVVNFVLHQVISRKTPSKIKELNLIHEDSMSSSGALTSGKERKGKERKGKGTGKGKEQDNSASNDAYKYSFEDFYNNYPVKKSKPQAMKAWGKLSNAQQVSAVELTTKFITGIAEGVSAPYPATYLNNRRWEDEPAQKIQQGNIAAAHQVYENENPVVKASPGTTLKDSLAAGRSVDG